MVGVAVAEMLQVFGLQGHGLKWPNDIYQGNRKLGGILLQTAKSVNEVVIGIGLNINMRNDTSVDIDQPWCSLVEVLGDTIDRNRLVASLLGVLIPALQRFPSLGKKACTLQWQHWDILEGQAITVATHTQRFSGVAQGIDEQGQLIVLLDSGEQQVFSAGDVSIKL